MLQFNCTNLCARNIVIRFSIQNLRYTRLPILTTPKLISKTTDDQFQPHWNRHLKRQAAPVWNWHKDCTNDTYCIPVHTRNGLLNRDCVLFFFDLVISRVRLIQIVNFAYSINNTFCFQSILMFLAIAILFVFVHFRLIVCTCLFDAILWIVNQCESSVWSCFLIFVNFQIKIIADYVSFDWAVSLLLSIASYLPTRFAAKLLKYAGRLKILTDPTQGHRKIVTLQWQS